MLSRPVDHIFTNAPVLIKYIQLVGHFWLVYQFNLSLSFTIHRETSRLSLNNLKAETFCHQFLKENYISIQWIHVMRGYKAVAIADLADR